jgi:beta-lactamase class D
MTRNARFAVLIALLSPSVPALAETTAWPFRPAEITDERQICLAVYSATTDSWLIHNRAQCERPLSPCSTFKIPNALIGLETGVLSGPGHALPWDGTQHTRNALNRDHDLASAIRDSVVWYFQEVARAIGPLRMQSALDRFAYGNRDISGGIDRFWLGDSLRISALQQVEFLHALQQRRLPATDANHVTLKTMLLQDYAVPEGFRGTLYGKTGSCPMPGDDHGWFVGILERDGAATIFAVNVIGEGRWGPDARRIAIRMLQQLP